ncbi:MULTISPECIES: hypothetical protein [Turicibacter]|uniref:hypothetical protein n=1 Tax=Turicibacter TaxID=191303 RepID=UPI0001FD9A0F|nr:MULTISPECIES: hypothetical protein [Turicibacter]EGC92650.1 putative lipoprotein [Turicibacter sp. HGF1]
MRACKIGIILILTLGLTGCQINSVNETFEKAKTLEEDGQYEKSILLLELVLEDDSDHEEAITLYSILSDYESAKEMYENGQLEETLKIIEDINSNYVNYAVKEDIEHLKEIIENHLTIHEEIENYLSEAQSLLENEQFDDCIMYLKVHILGTDTIKVNELATEAHIQQAKQLVADCEKGKIEYYLIVAQNLFNEEKYTQCIETIQQYITGDYKRDLAENPYASTEQIEQGAQLINDCDQILLNLMNEQTLAVTDEYIINEEYAINQISQLSNIREVINLGAKVGFKVEEDSFINGMTGWSIQVYEDNPDYVTTIGWYFMEYETGDLYVMDIAAGEYERVE